MKRENEEGEEEGGWDRDFNLNVLLQVIDINFLCILQVDLTTGGVCTLAGTGKQGKDKVGGAVGVAQEISSPWDVELGKSPGSDSFDVLYVAMAGTHQIWMHFLLDATWAKGRYVMACGHVGQGTM